MKNSRNLFLGLAAVLLLAVAYYFWQQNDSDTDNKQVLLKIEPSEFVIKVKATGELNAKNSEKIRGPQGMRSVRIYQTNITDLVPEGTIVKKGEYVATLDRTELDQKVKEVQSEIDEINTQLDQAIIDTAIEMQGYMNQLVNFKFSMDEKRLEVEQSKYEPQMVIRQAEIDMERTQRDYDQLVAKIELSRDKADAKLSEIQSRLYQKQLRLNQLIDISKEFRITAPTDGMVIYSRSWNGKVGPGSQISTWNPVVAELPDLSDMISKTYVNEVDISRVQKGQEVKVSVDAFPDDIYDGVVTAVANIGEQLRGYDAKVFEVTVQMLQTDSILRPAMTTSNEIITDIVPNKLAVPLEALHGDTVSFVYKKTKLGVVKQEVVTGLTNLDQVVIDHGVTEGDEVYLSIPQGDDFTFVPLDKSIKADIKARQLAEKAEKEAERKKRMQEMKDTKPPSSVPSGNGDVIITFN